MSFCITGNSANDLFEQSINAISSSGLIQQSRVGTTKEITHVTLSLSSPKNRILTCRKPTFSLAFAIAEMIDMLCGDGESTFLNHYNPSLPKYRGDYAIYPGAYSTRLKKSFCINQLYNAYVALSNNPDSRQIVLSIWNPRTDLPLYNGIPNNEDIPCNICSLLKIRNDKLEWTQILRSNDLIRGFAYDVFCFTLLQEIISGWLNASLGEYVHYSDSLHTYKTDSISMTKPADIQNRDDLRLNYVQSQQVLIELFKKATELASRDSSDKLVSNFVVNKSLPDSYHNLLMVLCMYNSYKTSSLDLLNKCYDSCTNDLYTWVMKQWIMDKTNANNDTSSTS